MSPGRTALEAAGVDLGTEYESLIDRLADRLMRPGDIVVDGGANTGRHTISFARRVAPGGVVHAFEPLADLVGANLGWARSEGLEAAIRYHAIGLSDVAGEVPFSRNTTNVALSSLRFDAPNTHATQISVQVDTLDRLFADTRVDFIKMDVEGAEFHAFRGGERLIARSRPFIVFENALQWAATCFRYGRDDFFALFERAGLPLFDAFGRAFTPTDWDDPDAGWYFCAVPPERLSPEAYRDLVAAFWRERIAAAPDDAPDDVLSDAPGGAQDDAPCGAGGAKAMSPAPAAHDPANASVATPDPAASPPPVAAPTQRDFTPGAILPPHLLHNARVLPTREHILLHLPKGLVVCEVGVALGDFTSRILDLCDVTRFIAVDLFDLHDYPQMWGGRVGATLAGRAHADYYTDRFRAQVDAGTLRLMAGRSVEMMNALPDHSVDVFYIDANHDYAWVSQELVVASRKTRPGGIIILDDYIMQDYTSGTPYGVVRAANEFMIEHNWEMLFFALHTGMYCNIALRRVSETGVIPVL